jgi:hypothetical protein
VRTRDDQIGELRKKVKLAKDERRGLEVRIQQALLGQ